MCPLSSGREVKGMEMNEYFVDKLRSLNGTRPAELAIMSTTDVEDILGAPIPIPGLSAGEPERKYSLSVDDEMHKQLREEAEASTPINSHLSIYIKRKSSMLEVPFQICEVPNSSRWNFKNEDEETPVARRVVVGQKLYGT